MSTTISPPPFVDKITYQHCKQINDPITNKRVYLTPDGDKTPSVTTILSNTKDLTHLNEWKNRVGHAKAQQITTEAANVGSAMHKNLECYVSNLPRQPGNNLIYSHANKMADVIINNGLIKIDEIWAIEQSLYYPGLYSGTTDLIAVYNGNLSICDYKQSNKPKKAEWIEDYYLQLAAYMLAHNAVYKTNIREGHIFMCTRELQYQQFDLWPDDYTKYEDMWLSRVEKYYSLLQ